MAVYSYVSGDPDYSGYDYSFKADLSHLRIVYLNRFILEVSAPSLRTEASG